MAQFSRIEVAIKAKETGIVPVFYNKDLEISKKVVEATYKGGARIFEFTNRGDFAHEIFADLVKYANKELPEMILGIGSLEEEASTALYLQLGANFVVSPVLNARMAKICNRRKVSWMPGCGSLSEISYAEELGAEIVKIFPAQQVGGPDFIKSAKAPKPFTNIMPTGGVKPEEENLKAWFEAGAYCVGMGSQLMATKENGEFDYDKIEELTRKSIAIAAKYKK
ncbi:MAG: bifunctional 4-hydroxy-2-oxoglutarate aldolase/2-dehydro-3-deoxy-phosphogluconate aldolase [Ichthyobacteriaceae bacterium]|nr:bifunctional 4-hydroxy-2-oxoglutarate aldolase/2-dehydro-3-deoxy-phosphogluconate aldolase [Ichthyobacteriaceae bacterium]